MKYPNLVDSIKSVVKNSPARCGRVYFDCVITRVDDTLKVKFTPTTEYFEMDDRKDDEGILAKPFSFYESHHHTGLAIGSLECFFQNNDIPYSIDESNSPEYFEVLVNV
jgi:hypothetical protein